MRQAWLRWPAVALGAALAVAGCGGGSSPLATAGSHDPAIAALADVADTTAARQTIAINDLGAVWSTAGLPVQPTQKQIESPGGLAAEGNLLAGSQIGLVLWEDEGSSPYGYDPFRLHYELAVGDYTRQIAEVWGPIRPSAVESALTRVHPATSTSGAETVLSLQRANLGGNSFSEDLIYTRHLILPAGGDRLVSGGITIPEAESVSLAEGKAVPHSLADDPDVKQLMALWSSPVPVSILMGTQVVESPTALAGSKATPAEAAHILAVLGLNRLPAAPVFAGLAEVGGPAQTAHWVAGAIYPSSSDAKAAASILGHDLRAGTSLSRDEPYSKIFDVSSVTAKGDEVVARFTQRKGNYLVQLMETDDFPLFWAPSPVSR